jgi:hypothetical protein
MPEIAEAHASAGRRCGSLAQDADWRGDCRARRSPGRRRTRRRSSLPLQGLCRSAGPKR